MYETVFKMQFSWAFENVKHQQIGRYDLSRPSYIISMQDRILLEIEKYTFNLYEFILNQFQFAM